MYGQWVSYGNNFPAQLNVSKISNKSSRKWGRSKMTLSKFPSFSDASIASFEQVFVSWCFTVLFTVIKKINL